jgi:hypothetical protein
MRILTFNQFVINEKVGHVDIDSYARRVAKAYADAPVKQSGVISVEVGDKKLEGTVNDFWDALNKSNHKLYKHILSKYDVEFVEEDPYETAQQMRKEVQNTGILKVYKGDSKHPYFSEEDNWVFRAVHDYYTHIITHSENFDLRGELRAYNTHAKLVPTMALPALFTELVGQVSYAIVNGKFPVQKMAILSGFDFKNVGY